MDTKVYKIGDAYPMPDGVSFCPSMATLNDVTYGCSREYGHDAGLSGTDHLTAEKNPPQRGKATTWRVTQTWARSVI